jgi:hypothetical protein
MDENELYCVAIKEIIEAGHSVPVAASGTRVASPWEVWKEARKNASVLPFILDEGFRFIGFIMDSKDRENGHPSISVEDCPNGYHCIEVFKFPLKPDEITCVAYGPTVEAALEDLKAAVDGGVLTSVGTKYKEPA